MQRQITIDELSERVSKEELSQFYSNHTFAETVGQFKLSPKQLSELMGYYNISKKNSTAKQKSEAPNTNISSQTLIEKVEASIKDIITSEIEKPKFDIETFLTEHKIKFVRDESLDGVYFDYILYSNLNPKIVLNYYTSDEFNCDYFDDYAKIKRLDVIYIPFIEEFADHCCNEILTYMTSDINKYVTDTFYWCRGLKEFPHPNYDEKFLEQSYSKLCATNDCTNDGLPIIYQFHKSFSEANLVNKLSPFGMWINDKFLLACIRNRWVYKSVDKHASKCLNGLHYSTICPPVDIVRPSQTKQLINKYLSEAEQIFNPCSGYSEVLLATCALNKSYVGYDINPKIISEGENIISQYKLDAKLLCKDSYNETGKFDALFTYIPSEKEQYFQNIMKYSAEKWMDKLMKNYECKSYLFAVNSDVNIGKYSQYVVETVEDIYSTKKIILVHT